MVDDFNPLHTPGQIIKIRFGVDHYRAQTGMPQQAGEPTQVIRIGLEIASRERIPQRIAPLRQLLLAQRQRMSL